MADKDTGAPEPIKKPRKTDFKELARKFREFRLGIKGGPINVKELIEEGRRH